jgi:hypothetical protein
MACKHIGQILSVSRRLTVPGAGGPVPEVVFWKCEVLRRDWERLSVGRNLHDGVLCQI